MDFIFQDLFFACKNGISCPVNNRTRILLLFQSGFEIFLPGISVFERDRRPGEDFQQISFELVIPYRGLFFQFLFPPEPDFPVIGKILLFRITPGKIHQDLLFQQPPFEHPLDAFGHGPDDDLLVVGDPFFQFRNGFRGPVFLQVISPIAGLDIVFLHLQ